MANLIHRFLENSAKKLPTKTALVFQNRAYTYSELNQLADRVTDGVRQVTEFQSPVAIIMANSPEFVVSYFGILKSGRVAVPIELSAPDEVILARLNHSRARLVLVGDLSLGRFNDHRFRKFDVVAVGDFFNRPDSEKKSGPIGKITPRSLASILYTTGTTGEPKGVILSHAAICRATGFIIRRLGIRRSDTDVNALSLVHSFGLGHIHCLFSVGGTVILRRDFINLKELLSDIQRYKATTFSAPPPVWDSLADHFSALLSEQGRTLRYFVTNSAPIAPETSRKIIAALPGVDFYTYYGLTEASRSTFHNLSENTATLDSVGSVSPGVRIKILGANGKTCRDGEVGEIVISSPAQATGYWRSPDLTKKAFRGRKFYSGDAGFFKKRLLYFVGRQDDLLNIGGRKTYPEAIEALIKNYPVLVDIAIFSIPDMTLGEAVGVAVVVKSKASFDEKDFLKFCRSRLESFQVPKRVFILSALPKSGSGKLKRSELKKLAR